MNFRRFSKFEVGDFHSQLNVIVGNNAQGKTSILEALSYLTQLKSFRTSNSSELIQEYQKQASISVEIAKPSASKVVIGFEEKRKLIKIDEKKIASKQKYSFLGTSVSFIPDDLYLIKGGPEQRRSFFDELTINLDPSNVSIYQQFQKILKQRNRLLKQIKDGFATTEQLEVWTERYIESALQVYRLRNEALTKLVDIIPQIYERLFDINEKLEIEYDHGFEAGILPNDETMRNRLSRLTEAECAVGYSLVGPHRDDFIFNLNNLKARSFASQGQTRSLVIALKVAQLELTREARDWSPILLLDDIISELDEKRVRALVHYLSAYDGQLFVTTAETNKLQTLHSEFSGFKLVEVQTARPSETREIIEQESFI